MKPTMFYNCLCPLSLSLKAEIMVIHICCSLQNRVAGQHRSSLSSCSAVVMAAVVASSLLLLYTDHMHRQQGLSFHRSHISMVMVMKQHRKIFFITGFLRMGGLLNS